MQGTVLIVDDERQLASFLERLLVKKGFDVHMAQTAAEARRKMESCFPDVALMDLRLPDADGMELMSSLIKDHPDTSFIVMTAYGSIKSAVESTRLGAVDYLTKPFEPEELILTIENTMRSKVLADEVRKLRSQARGSVPPLPPSKRRSASVYSSPAMRQTLFVARKAAQQDGIVLLLGKSGTGKDYLARWIHRESKRSEGPFFSINCAAVTRELAESELFGHEPGAFTGTRGRKRGMLELADKGTIFLDEIGEMDPVLQSKLLSFLDTKTFMRVGGEKPISIDARIIAATNRDLQNEVETGRFRQDLFYRLNVMQIVLPSLEKRIDDIPVLVEEILETLSGTMCSIGRVTISTDAMERLKSYKWPGNVRELRNVIERAMITCFDGVINAVDLNLDTAKHEWFTRIEFPSRGQTLHDITKMAAKATVEEALRRAGNKTGAARLLGISRHSLNYQLKMLDME